MLQQSSTSGGLTFCMSVDFVKWNLRSTLARFCGVLARSPCKALSMRRQWAGSTSR